MPALESVLGRVPQLANGRASAFAEFYIELDGSNAVFVRVHELSSQVVQDFRRTPDGSVFGRRQHTYSRMRRRFMTATLSLTCDGYFLLTRLAHCHGPGVFVVPLYRLCRC